MGKNDIRMPSVLYGVGAVYKKCKFLAKQGVANMAAVTSSCRPSSTGPCEPGMFCSYLQECKQCDSFRHHLNFKFSSDVKTKENMPPTRLVLVNIKADYPKLKKTLNGLPFLPHPYGVLARRTYLLC